MQLEISLFFAYCVFVTFVLGLCMGSFLNCMAWRMTHGESVLKGRSHCATCGHVLAARDLVPVLSWVITQGRCRYCGQRISARYPLTELVCASSYVLVVLRYGLSAQALQMLAFCSVLLVLSLTDIDDYVIPNSTIVACVVIRLAYVAYVGLSDQGDLWGPLAQTFADGFVVAVPVLALALVMDRVLGRESFGGGDIKLLFVAGMYFGWRQCMFLIVVACVLGIACGILARNGRGRGKESALIPFGPSIAAACLVTMMVGEQVLAWYVGLL